MSPSHSKLIHHARQSLAEHSQLRGKADNLEFELHNGVLKVRGFVPSFYLKQLLQTILLRLDGVDQIDNQVEVVVAKGSDRADRFPRQRLERFARPLTQNRAVGVRSAL